MRKLWTIFTVALVALVAVACDDNKIGDENKVPTPPASNSVTFTVTAEDLTRTYLEADGEVYHTKWVGNETLCVVSEGKVFKFVNSFAAANKFVCKADGVAELVGKSVEIIYTKSGEADGNVDSAAGAAGAKLAATVTLENDGEYKLDVVSAFLLYSSATEVTFTAPTALFCDAGELKSTMTLPAGNTVFVPIVATADAAECELSYTLAGQEAVKVAITPAYNKMNDLGVLTPTETPDTPTPDTPTGDAAIFLVPGDGWSSDGAWFAAYFWSDASSGSIKLTDENSDGIYEGKIPVGMSGMLFCRMNPAYSSFSWNTETETDHVWNQTADTTVGVAPANYYYVIGWDNGEWNQAGYTAPETPVAPSGSDFALAGTFSDWGDVAMENNNGIYSAKNVTMEAYAEFKIKAASSWNENYGGGIAYLNPNNHMAVVSGGGNIAITEAGVYDVYFDLANLKLYVVTAGADYTTAPLQSTNGAAPVITDGVVIYLNAGGSSLWDQSDSYFEAWAWATGGSGKWYTMTKAEEGIYQTIIPAGIDNIIFVRRAPTHSAGSWDDNQRWNKTDDLAIPAGYNLYTITGWGGSDGTWSIK